MNPPPFPLIFALLSSALALGLAAAPSAPTPPNIVVIVADDLGFNDLGSSGRKDHATPHLDRFASQGWRATQASAAAPLCSASRAALLTGKHPARLHLTTYLPGRADTPAQKLRSPRIEGQLPLEEVTIAEFLREAGYATACLGKWHLGHSAFGPAAQGFQTVHPGRSVTTPSASEGSKGEMELATAAADFIHSHRDRPFFLYIAHDSPHLPYAATPEDVARHRDAFNPTYAAVIESLDASVGRVLEAIDSHDLAARTLVVFASDNGGLHVPELGQDPPTHNSPLRAGKGFLYEGGLRVPLLVRWPGVTTPGSVSEQPVILTDLLPTLLEAAGQNPATTTGPLDGVSLMPLLRGDSLPPRDLYWHFPHYSNQGGRPSGALRQDQWKLIENFEDGTVELYDLKADPSESLNLATTTPEVAERLKARLTSWRDRHGAQMPVANPEFVSTAAAPLYRDTDVTTPPAATTAAEAGRQWAPWRAAMDAAAAGRSPSVRTPDDTIRLLARHARTHGRTMRYEPEPFKDTLGYWVDAGDWADWTLDIPKAGVYEVEVLQGCGGGNGGSEVEVRLGGQSLRFTVRETGHFQHFIQVPVGEVTLAAGPHTLELRPLTKAKAAVMDVRRVVVRPAAQR